MPIFKGDRVYRTDGTAVGFRRHCYYEVEDVSRSHIKVKNDGGLISKWFERKDFMWIQAGNLRRVDHYMIVTRSRDGIIDTKFKFTRLGAVTLERELIAEGHTILAKKRVTIPYQEAV